jgi:hypothetical protein
MEIKMLHSNLTNTPLPDSLTIQTMDSMTPIDRQAGTIFQKEMSPDNG